MDITVSDVLHEVMVRVANDKALRFQSALHLAGCVT